MIVEILSVLSSFTGGFIVSKIIGLKGWYLAGFGILIGFSIQTVIGFVLLASVLPNSPLLLIILTTLIPAIVLLLRTKRPLEFLLNRYYLLPVFIISLLVIILRSLNLVSWSVDTISYLEVGTLFTQNNYGLIEASRAIELPLSTGLLNSPANMIGEYYLRSITTIFGISILFVFVWLFLNGVKKYTDRKTATAFAVAGIILLMSINRFIFNLFYMNNHIFFTGGLLLLVGCGWLTYIDGLTQLSKRGLIFLQSALIPMLILSRPEAPLIVFFALLPMLVNKKVIWDLRRIPLIVLSVSILSLQGFFAYQFFTQGSWPSYSVFGLLIAALTLLFLSIFVKERWVKTLSQIKVLYVVEVALWVLLIFSAIINPGLFARSLSATYQNVVLGSGSWGLSLVLIGAVAAYLGATRKLYNSIALRFPVTTFVPLMLIVIFLLGTAYRVGNGDSLNRALIHIVPVLVLYVIVLAAVGADRPWFKKLKKKFT